MGKGPPFLAAETEALRDAYAALNRGDIAGFIAGFDPQIERIELIESADFPRGTTYKGIEAVKAHVSKGRGTWAEGGCEPERFIVAGDRIVALVHVRVRLKHETDWREGRTVDVFTFRNGKAIEFRTFARVEEGLKWAGVKAGPAGEALDRRGC